MRYTKEYIDDLDKCWTIVPSNTDLIGKSILITGATGLIGSSIADILLRRNELSNENIHLIFAGRNAKKVEERFYIYKKDKDYEFCEYDATEDKECGIRADYIIHAASNADPVSYATKPVETILSNIVGLKTLLETSRNTKGSRVLYISSSEVYGKDLKAPYKEDEYGYVDILDARSCYPSAKRCGETLCAAYRSQYDVDVVIVRPGHIYGPMFTEKDSKASAQFARKAFGGDDIVLKSRGNQMRSYCYSLDCATAILTVLVKGVSGDAYNISNRNSLATISDLAQTFAKKASVTVRYEKPSASEKEAFNKMSNSTLDSQKLESLGWQGVFTLSEGVERTINSMQ